MFRSRPQSIAIVALVACALLAARAATARPAVTFASKLYAYSIILPGSSSRWGSHFATERWSGTSIGGIDSPAVDTFTDFLTGRRYLLAAQPTTLDAQQWTRFMIAARSSRCASPHVLGNSTLGGSQASVVTWSCSDGYRVYVAAALHGDNGYFMLVASPKILSRTSDLRAFAAARKSFRLISA